MALKWEPQISPLRYAPVEMTNLFEGGLNCSQASHGTLPWEQGSSPPTNLSSRAQPRDLRFRGPVLEMLFALLHLERDFAAGYVTVGGENLPAQYVGSLGETVAGCR